MSQSVQLSDTLQTTCPACGSIFRIGAEHLESAKGQVQCGECQQVFNALLTLENYTGDLADSVYKDSPLSHQVINHQSTQPTEQTEMTIPTAQSVTLKQAMYGINYSSQSPLKPLLWFAGILILLIVAIIQAVYYQRYKLIALPHYQQQILNLCQLMPCDETRFSSLSQIKLLERNIFTHPTRSSALMVSGSFVNEASFSQPIPGLLISLSDTRGKFIAHRLFKPEEYLDDKSLKRLQPGVAIQFRIEIHDPGNEALAYEFEFLV
ncbi:MAG: zinc-ribbon domain-containing protein [Gammaproteobacteria bacterium]|nr:zinc-ribbon domain-containing protein [Gammaproteobacteria bacterium]